jgi:hypothetical protein
MEQLGLDSASCVLAVSSITCRKETGAQTKRDILKEIYIGKTEKIGKIGVIEKIDLPKIGGTAPVKPGDKGFLQILHLVDAGAWKASYYWRSALSLGLIGLGEDRGVSFAHFYQV